MALFRKVSGDARTDATGSYVLGEAMMNPNKSLQLACAGAAHWSDQQTDAGQQSAKSGARPKTMVIRLENLPATAENLERIRERALRLNRQLAASAMPFRVRVL
jgi:hypothetical protein